MRTVLTQAIRGFLIGSADLVPGVSGGTVALVLGIYERLVATIHTGAQALGNLVRGRPRLAWQRLTEISWAWLLGLLGGILVAVFALASLVTRLLESHPQVVAGLFFGLITGSVIVAWRLLRRSDLRKVGLAAASAVVAFVVLGLRADPAESGAVAGQPGLWIFFLSGALAIGAMILPGISGSFILVMVGMYGHVLGAVNDRDILVVGVFAAGCVVGLALFSTLLSWLLAHHHDRVLAVLIGVMVGSLRVLWPWPDGLNSTDLGAPSTPLWGPIGLVLAGFVVVVGIDLIARDATARRNQARTTPS